MARRGVVWHGGGSTGSGPLAVACGCERTGDGPRRGKGWPGWAGLGTARQGGARQGKGCNQALALGGRLHQKERSGRTAWKPWNLADHLAQASRLMGGILARRTAKSERLTKRPVPDYLRRAHTFI